MFPGDGHSLNVILLLFSCLYGLPVSVTRNDTTKEDASVGGCDGHLLIMVGGVGIRRALRAAMTSRLAVTQSAPYK